MSNASFWFVFSHSQLNGLKSAFKGPDCIWRANWSHIAYPKDQIGVVSVTALQGKQNVSVRPVFLIVIWVLLLVVLVQAVPVVTEAPANPLQSMRSDKLDPALDGSSLVFSCLLKGLFQFLLKSAEDFSSRPNL